MTKPIMTTSEIKKKNQALIFQYIYNHKQTSKQQIAAAYSMSLTTVTQILKQLQDQNLIRRSGFYESTGGRPAYAIEVNSSARLAAGIEILKDRVHFVVVDLYGRCILSRTDSLAFAPTAEYCASLSSGLDTLITGQNLDPDAILGVSIAIQGIVAADGQSLMYGNILNHPPLSLPDFQAVFPYPCRLEHDSKAAAFLEIWHQESFRDALILLLNENLGSAVVVGGRIHSGLHTHSGTIEHLCVTPDGPLCYCGQNGCLEVYCSAGSLAQQTGQAPADFFAAVRNNESTATALWSEYLNHLANALRNLTVILDTPVILSGLLSPWLNQDDLDVIYDKLAGLSPFPPARDFIHISTHGHLAPAIGGALHYIDRFLTGYSR